MSETARERPKDPRMNRDSVVSALMAAVLLPYAMATPAQRETEDTAPDRPREAASEGDWSVRLGIGAIQHPEYPGADSHDTAVLPLIDARYGESLYISTARGIGWNAIHTDKFTIGPFIAYAGGRDDKGPLAPLAEVDGGALGGVRIHFEAGRLHLGAEVGSALSGDIDGERVRLRVTWRDALSDSLRYAIGPRIQWVDDDWNEALFSLSAAEADQIGLSPYAADGGVSTAGLQARLTRDLTPRWSATAILGMSEMLGDAADSPIVDDVGDETQLSGGLLLAYRF